MTDQKNLNTYPSPQNEIDLIEFTRKISKSRKLILFTTLIFLMLSFFYIKFSSPLNKSIALYEIGSYSLADGSVEFFEDPEDLIDLLNVYYVFTNNSSEDFKVEFSNLNDIAIKIAIISKSSLENYTKLQEIIQFSDARYLQISSKKLSHQEKTIQNQLAFFEKVSENSLDSLSDEKTENGNALIFTLEILKNISQLQNELSDLNSIVVNKSKVISEVKNEIQGLSDFTILFFGLISGLFSGIVLTLVIDFRNAYIAKIRNEH